MATTTAIRRTSTRHDSTAATEELADEVATAVHALVTGADDEPWNALIMKIAAKTAKNDHGIAAVSLAQAVSELARVKRGLEARLAALEQRPELKYAGVWQQSDVYGVGMLVTFKGSLWIAKKPSVSRRPGLDDSWQLCCRSGRDGRDGKDAAPAVQP